MLVATIREYPWTAPKMWAVVWDVWSRDGMATRSQTCRAFFSKDEAVDFIGSDAMKEFPNHSPRIVEVVNGYENRLVIDAATVSHCTVKELFTSDVYAKETLTAVYNECERNYLRTMQAAGMMESTAP